MRVLQFAKRSIFTLSAVCAVLSSCAEPGPEVPFNPTGTAADLDAVNSAFGSSTFESFSSLSPLFDAALGGSPLVSASAGAMNFRRSSAAGELRAAAVQSARRLAAILPRTKNGHFSASAAAIPVAAVGKTFVYSPALSAYVASDLTGAPSNGVRFLLYALDPLTGMPADPLNVLGQVELSDLSGSSTNAARVVVASETMTYLDYTVSSTSTTASGRVTMTGFVTDGTHRANFNLRSTLTFSTGLSLVYSLDVPQRDASIDLTLTTTGLNPESGNIDLILDMHGPNGTVGMTGQFTTNGGALTVKVNGRTFATITSTTGSDPVITGAAGQVLTDQDIEALGHIFAVSDGAFTSFDQLLAPVGGFIGSTP